MGDGISTLKLNNGYTYTYDGSYNITKIVHSDGKEVRYYYDNLSQLVREDNGLLNYTYVYAYDNAGNLTSVKRYALTSEGATPSGGYPLGAIYSSKIR